MLFPYAPLPPPRDLAGTKRNLPFLLELAKYNEVTVLSFGTPEDEKIFRNSYEKRFANIHFVNARRPRIINGLNRIWLLATGRSVFRQLYKPSMQRAISQLTQETRFDVIHCCVQFFGYYKFPDDIPVTSDTHEVKYDLLRRTAEKTKNLFSKYLYYLSYRFGKREELELCSRFRILTTTTERDKEVFRKHLPNQRIEVVQNGAGVEFFEELQLEPEPNTMVFTGLFTHLPNSDGIIWFIDEILPLILQKSPDARVYVVGKNPTRQMLARKSKNIIITGFVDDVRPYIARAQVFIIPLLAGGGIRGKALEAMAMKKPIVTTTIGVEGIHLKHNESALFADDEGIFAKSVVDLFVDADLRGRLSREAGLVAMSKYDWVAKGKELNKHLLTVKK